MKNKTDTAPALRCEDWLGEQAKVVNETDDYGQGYSENKFGFCIGDRVWWVGMEGYGHDEERAKQQKAFCREIVRRWNAPNTPVTDAESSTPANTRAHGPRSV